MDDLLQPNEERLLQALLRASPEHLRSMLEDEKYRAALGLQMLERVEAHVASMPPPAPPRRGRPTKPLSERKQTRIIQMSDDMWNFCLEQEDGASAYLRRLVQQDRAQGEQEK